MGYEGTGFPRDPICAGDGKGGPGRDRGSPPGGRLRRGAQPRRRPPPAPARRFENKIPVRGFRFRTAKPGMARPRGGNSRSGHKTGGRFWSDREPRTPANTGPEIQIRVGRDGGRASSGRETRSGAISIDPPLIQAFRVERGIEFRGPSTAPTPTFSILTRATGGRSRRGPAGGPFERLGGPGVFRQTQRGGPPGGKGQRGVPCSDERRQGRRTGRAPVPKWKFSRSAAQEPPSKQTPVAVGASMERGAISGSQRSRAGIVNPWRGQKGLVG